MATVTRFKMDKRTKKALIISAVFCIVLFCAVLITVLVQPGKGINRNDYDMEIREILADENASFSGTKIVPYDVKKDIYVFDVDYQGKRLIPLKYVAQSDVQIGAVLRYELSSSSDYSWYKDKSGNNVKGYHQELWLSLVSLATDEELAHSTFRSELPDSTTVESVNSFVQYFSDEELQRISDWIGEMLREHLGYEE